MALDPEFQSALAAELRTSVYDAQTSAWGFDVLHNGVPSNIAVAAPMTLQAILGAVGQASQTKLINNPNLTDIRDKIVAQDHQAVGLWNELLLATSQITQAEHDAIAAIISATVQQQTRATPRIQTQFVNVVLPSGAGFPNYVSQEDFNAAWTAAGRS